MSDQDNRFADVMRQERQRLDQERQAIFNQQRELESKLAAIDREMAAVAEAKTAADPSFIHDAVARLAAVTEEFASRRMDQSVRSALAGKTLDEV